MSGPSLRLLASIDKAVSVKVYSSKAQLPRPLRSRLFLIG
jgi:hypothetical protein